MADETTYRKLQKKAFAICRNAGLSRTDRLDLARELLGGDVVTSFNDLSEIDLQDLCFALTGWDTVQKLRLSSGALLYEAKAIVAADAKGYVESLEEIKPFKPEAVEASESASKDASEDREPSETMKPESAHQEPQSDVEDDALSPEIASAFASTRKSRKLRG